MRIFWILVCLVISIPGHGQRQVLPASASPDSLRISLLTCGVGDELYASFGHSGIRIINYTAGTDEVYNYGAFDFSDPDFYQKFTLGKLLYYLDKANFRQFMSTYVHEERSVREQVLRLPTSEKQEIKTYLETNLRPENRSYPYDFLFDNCATRIRDIFPAVLGNDFFWGTALPGEQQISYRTILNRYLIDKHWERLGINLLLGSNVDSIMSNEGSMFLPDFLHAGIKNAGYRSAPLVESETLLLPAGSDPVRHVNGPLWTMIGVLILTILSFHVKAFAYLKPILRFLILFVSGLLGCFMLFMWLGTEHAACADNFNILWALPLNLIVAFLAGRRHPLLKIYALAAISILMVGLLVHIIGIQKLPLIELAPFLLCLMYVYIDLYKHSVDAPTPISDTQNTSVRS